MPEDKIADSHFVDHTRRRTALRLLPFLFVLYIANFLDRTSVSYAAIGMSRDLNFSDNVFGLGVGVFFIGYLALQIPGALLAERWSARKTISASMILWGTLTVLTALVHTPTELYFARFFLGVAEGSFFPAVILYLSHWFMRKDRAKAASNYMAAVPLSLLIGSPIAGWTMGHDWFHFEGWRWLFVLEGMPAVLVGIGAFFYLSDWPRDAAWLSPEQRCWIMQELEAEKPVDRHTVSVMETMRSGKVLLLGAVAFFAYFSAYSVIFWLPTLLKRQTGLPDLRVGLLLTIPFGTGLVAMLINGWHSDRYLERRWHAATPVFMAALGALGLIALPQSLPMTLFLFSLLCSQVAFLPTFWAIPMEVLSEAAAAPAVGVISCIANIAGFFGPTLFGYLHTRTGSLTSGYAMLMTSAVASAVLILVVPGMRRPAPTEFLTNTLSAEA